MLYMETKKRTSLFLSEHQLKELARLSEETGAPVAELVRRAIDLYLERQKGKDKPGKGQQQE